MTSLIAAAIVYSSLGREMPTARRIKPSTLRTRAARRRWWWWCVGMQLAAADSRWSWWWLAESERAGTFNGQLLLFKATLRRERAVIYLIRVHSAFVELPQEAFRQVPLRGS